MARIVAVIGRACGEAKRGPTRPFEAATNPSERLLMSPGLDRPPQVELEA